ncbi:MAG: hypothetical protein KF708_15640 [Pirellulales bacterium]|nr:hypothetical protein [Pirellulales bacterium]
MISTERLTQLLGKFAGLRIGLVGDLFLDRYLDIDPELAELSIETGLEAYQVTRIRNNPGALGTVMNNLTALGVGQLVPVTVLGDDGQAYDLFQALAAMPVDRSHILQDPTRMTPTYTKPMRRNSHGEWVELNRLDLRNRVPLAPHVEDQLMEHVTQVFEATDGLIVLDQVNEEGWGVIGPRVREHLAMLADRQPEKLMFVDSRAFIHKFTRGTLKPNLNECLRALGRAASEDPQVGRAAAVELSQKTGLRMFCTLGERGMLVVRPHADPVEVPAVEVAGPIDIVGAGDSATSGIVASLLSGADEIEAATVGNLVASITIQQLGTTGTASPEQVVARCRESQRS